MAVFAIYFILKKFIYRNNAMNENYPVITMIISIINKLISNFIFIYIN